MGKGSIGVNTSTVIHTKNEADKKYDLAKNARKKKRSSQCIGCESNHEGFCQEKKNWCYNAQPYCQKCVQQQPKPFAFTPKPNLVFKLCRGCFYHNKGICKWNRTPFNGQCRRHEAISSKKKSPTKGHQTEKTNINTTAKRSKRKKNEL